MQVTIAILVVLGIGAVSPSSTAEKTDILMDKDLLVKQIACFLALLRTYQPTEVTNYKELDFNSDENLKEKMFNKFDKSMEDFITSWSQGLILPKGEFFTLLKESHEKQTEGLTKMFFYAKGMRSFADLAMWAKQHVNEDMFVTAFTAAVMRRDDMKYVTIPALNEIFPEHFYDEKVVDAAGKFDIEEWGATSANETKKGEWNRAEPKETDFFKDVPKFWIKADFTNSIVMKNEEAKLAYLTEDPDWNMYWYYVNMKYPRFLKGEEFNFDKERRGERWMFHIQQLLARYSQERLSNQLGEIPQFNASLPIDAGYNPHLKLHNGTSFSERPNFWNLTTNDNVRLFKTLDDWAKRLRETIHSAEYNTTSGKSFDFRSPETVELLGNILDGNRDSVDPQFFGAWLKYSQIGASQNNPESFNSSLEKITPNAMLRYDTFLRDPLSYRMLKTIAGHYRHLTFHLGPYEENELNFQGVEIKDMHVDELKTFFSPSDSDLFSLLAPKYMTEKYTRKYRASHWPSLPLVRQSRLDHKPFAIKFQIESDKDCEGVIRVFLGPRNDLNASRENFFLLEKFHAPLKIGQNEIRINSEEFNSTRDGFVTFFEYFHKSNLAFENEASIGLNEYKNPTAFPQRLQLPKGSANGLPMKIFAIASKYEPNKGFEEDYLAFDKRSLRFPLDRPMPTDEDQFWKPNMFSKDVQIFLE